MKFNLRHITFEVLTSKGDQTFQLSVMDFRNISKFKSLKHKASWIVKYDREITKIQQGRTNNGC